jgi:hypothetical protein
VTFLAMAIALVPHDQNNSRQKIVCIEVICILERHCRKARAGVSDFLTFKNILHDLNYKNANSFLVLNYPNDRCIEFLCTTEADAGRMTYYHFKSREAICTWV